MYAFGVGELRVVTVVSCVLKASYFIHRDFTVWFVMFLLNKLKKLLTNLTVVIMQGMHSKSAFV